jgi:hypothetical protein
MAMLQLLSLWLEEAMAMPDRFRETLVLYRKRASRTGFSERGSHILKITFVGGAMGSL